MNSPANLTALASIAPYAAVIAAAVTATLGLYWHFYNDRSAREQTFLKKQMELCFEASECVATLATTSDKDTWEASRDRFWQLFYGGLAIVEGKQVEEWMVKSAALIPATGSAPSLPVSELCGPSLKLSLAVRTLLLESWKIQSLRESLTGNSLPFEESRDPGFFELVRKTYREEYARQLVKMKAPHNPDIN